MARVIADCGEPAVIVAALKRAVPAVVVLEQPWDYTVVGAHFIVGVERKGGNDLLASLADGRLYEQAREMVAACDLAFVAYDSPVRPDGRGRAVVGMHGGLPAGWLYRAFLARMVSFAAAGVHFIHVPAANFVDFVALVGDWADREQHLAPQRRRIPLEALDRRIAALDVLCPGIGPKKAAALLEHFGGLWQVLLNVDRWEEVKGIGPAVVTQAKEVLR